ncbi:hypothetical protein USDA257_p00540 (plasmid) [Sinorhizobium fredii USDA 257]|uniref:Uncharacterized protein n=1 Tax=Sinorhizobium fredii (strain USDA 257) TaxID=1185652 RepID=I3XFW6_SINF2|nr:hypothetical protein USDA257_p00540 [Sinorhizobium fredii USDA 257]
MNINVASSEWAKGAGRDRAPSARVFGERTRDIAGTLFDIETTCGIMAYTEGEILP